MGSLFIPVVNEPHSKVPNEFAVGEICVFVEAVESLAFELVSVSKFDVFEHVLMHLHSTKHFQRVLIEVVKVIVCISRSVNRKQQSVVANLTVEGLIDC